MPLVTRLASRFLSHERSERRRTFIKLESAKNKRGLLAFHFGIVLRETKIELTQCWARELRKRSFALLFWSRSSIREGIARMPEIFKRQQNSEKGISVS